MASDGKVVISTALDNNGLEKGINNISGSLGGLKSVVGKLGGVIAAAFSVKALVDFSKSCIEIGSDLAEVQNVVDVAFGAMSDKAEEFASNAIRQFGMSELAAKKTASTYMAMAKGLGVAEAQATDMAVSLAGLSGDVASFFNLDQEAAAIKLQGVFTGETEALKALGVVMTQTNLKQFALANGMNANIETMSQAELVALRYAFVTDALSLASGDFVRTQDSWANQTRILSMQWQQFMGIIGQTLTTVLLPAIKTLNNVVASLISAANAVASAVASIFGVQVLQNTNIATSAGDAAKAENELAQGITAASKAAKKSLAGFDELNVLQDKAGGSGSGGSTSGYTVATNSNTTITEGKVDTEKGSETIRIINEISAAWERFANLLSPSAGAWSSCWEKIKSTLEQEAPGISSSIDSIRDDSLLPLLAYIRDDFTPTVANSWSEAFAPIIGGAVSTGITVISNRLETVSTDTEDATNNIIIPALENVKTAWSGAMDSIKKGWDEYGQPISDKVIDFGDKTDKTYSDLYNDTIKPMLEGTNERAKKLLDESLNPLYDNVVLYIGSVINWMLTLWNKVILPFVNWIVNRFGPPISRIFSSISTVVTNVAGGISDAVSIILIALRGITDFMSKIFEGDWKGAWNVVKRTISDVWEGIVRLLKNRINSIIGYVNTMISSAVTGINAIIKAINKLNIKIPDWVPGLGGKQFGFNIQSITPPQIPYLAQGAVLPANKPFLAMVGDQRHGTNIEAPLSTIQEAVALVMADMMAGSIAGQETVVAVLQEILEAVLGIHIGDSDIAMAVDRYRTKMAVVNGAY